MSGNSCQQMVGRLTNLYIYMYTYIYTYTYIYIYRERESQTDIQMVILANIDADLLLEVTSSNMLLL